MKASSIFVLALLAFVSTSCVIDGLENSISGNGRVVEDTRNISDFIGVHVSSGIDVFLSQGDEFSVVVEADENLQDVIETGVKGDVDVSSAGDARVHATEEISMSASSAGDIYYTGDARVVRSKTSSAGSIIKK